MQIVAFFIHIPGKIIQVTNAFIFMAIQKI